MAYTIPLNLTQVIYNRSIHSTFQTMQVPIQSNEAFSVSTVPTSQDQLVAVNVLPENSIYLGHQLITLPVANVPMINFVQPSHQSVIVNVLPQVAVQSQQENQILPPHLSENLENDKGTEYCEIKENNPGKRQMKSVIENERENSNNTHNKKNIVCNVHKKRKTGIKKLEITMNKRSSKRRSFKSSELVEEASQISHEVLKKNELSQRSTKRKIYRNKVKAIDKFEDDRKSYQNIYKHLKILCSSLLKHDNIDVNQQIQTPVQMLKVKKETDYRGKSVKLDHSVISVECSAKDSEKTFTTVAPAFNASCIQDLNNIETSIEDEVSEPLINHNVSKASELPLVLDNFCQQKFKTAGFINNGSQSFDQKLAIIKEEIKIEDESNNSSVYEIPCPKLVINKEEIKIEDESDSEEIIATVVSPKPVIASIKKVIKEEIKPEKKVVDDLSMCQSKAPVTILFTSSNDLQQKLNIATSNKSATITQNNIFAQSTHSKQQSQLSMLNIYKLGNSETASNSTTNISILGQNLKAAKLTDNTCLEKQFHETSLNRSTTVSKTNSLTKNNCFNQKPQVSSLAACKPKNNSIIATIPVVHTSRQNFKTTRVTVDALQKQQLSTTILNENTRITRSNSVDHGIQQKQHPCASSLTIQKSSTAAVSFSKGNTRRRKKLKRTKETARTLFQQLHTTKLNRNSTFTQRNSVAHDSNFNNEFLESSFTMHNPENNDTEFPKIISVRSLSAINILSQLQVQESELIISKLSKTNSISISAITPSNSCSSTSHENKCGSCTYSNCKSLQKRK